MRKGHWWRRLCVLLALVLVWDLNNVGSGRLERVEHKGKEASRHVDRKLLALSPIPLEPSTVKAMPDENCQNLIEAVKKGDARAAVTALLRGADPSTFVDDFFRSSLLHLATKPGHLKLVQVLLQGGAETNTRDRFQLTPLHYAAVGYAATVQVLLDKGANPSQADVEGYSPLHYAAFHGAVDVIKVLARYGANLDQQDRFGHTALHQAAKSAQLEAVKVLLKVGADRSIADNTGATALEEICASTLPHLCTRDVMGEMRDILHE